MEIFLKKYGYEPENLNFFEFFKINEFCEKLERFVFPPRDDFTPTL